MLLALVGVTGVGKSYYTNKIVEEFNFKKVNTIRTRAPRRGEKGLFMNKKRSRRTRKKRKNSL